ncbi:MAG TPA: FAD-binding protein, partial [Verrucomicrobiota bacterium]|nr:FAD-binding protein [Verrucomicrobiota bacterium]
MALDQSTLDKLRRLVGAGNVLTAKEDLIPYAFDGTAALKETPGCVVFAASTEHVSNVLKLANDTGTPVVTRGSGTGLSGGSVPAADCIVLCTVKMEAVLEVDAANLTMTVEPGVTTIQIAEAAEKA